MTLPSEATIEDAILICNDKALSIADRCSGDLVIFLTDHAVILSRPIAPKIHAHSRRDSLSKLRFMRRFGFVGVPQTLNLS